VGINAEALQSPDALFANRVAPKGGEEGHALSRQSCQLYRHHGSGPCRFFKASKGTAYFAGLGQGIHLQKRDPFLMTHHGHTK